MGAMAADKINTEEEAMVDGNVNAEAMAEQQLQVQGGKAVITPTQFTLWKQRKDAEAAAKVAEAARKRAEDVAAGRVRMNGRELFVHEPWVFDDSRFE